jgi:peptide/nickel transport system permease protein
MTSYLVRRVAWAALLFLVMSFVTYLIFFVIPTESSRIGRGQAAETIDLRTVIPLEGSILEEYGQFVRQVAQGDLGYSYVTRRDVSEILLNAAPVTASLVLGGAIIWMLIAVPVGMLSALRPRSLLDRFATVFVLIGISAHPVWIGLILSYVFGVRLGLMPTGGYCDLVSPTTACGGPVQWAWHLVLPWLTFALMFAAIYMRMVRASVLEALGDDYVRTARAKGASESQIMRVHVLRNSMLPVVTMLGMDIGLALGGAVFVERVYGLPGLGGIAVQSLGRRDLPVIMGVVLFATFAVIVFNLLVDLLYTVLDPRSRLHHTDFEGSGARTRGTHGSPSRPHLRGSSERQRGRQADPSLNAVGTGAAEQATGSKPVGERALEV